MQKISATFGTAGGYFGHAVALDGDTLVVGAPYEDTTFGAAYVFERNQGGADNWGQVRKKPGQSSGSEFGDAVAIDGEIIAVGAPAEIKAYVFGRNVSGMDQWGHLKTLHGSSGSGFGQSVALADGTLSVGAYTAPASGVSSAGAVNVYKGNRGGADNWGQVSQIAAADGASGDTYGWAVAMDGDVILVGAHGDDLNTGSAYLYREGPFAVHLPLTLRGYP